MSAGELRRPKDVIFFDGDGTLWYPRTTLGERKPHWVYLDEDIGDPIAEMIATPNAVDSLRRLGEQGIKRILLSTSPLEEDEALLHRKAIAQHVGIFDLLDEIHVAPEVVDGKARKIAAWLTKHQMSPDRALMIGDTYEWDILAANSVGVEGLLIDSEHEAKVIQDNGITDILINDLSHVHALLSR